jgi:hypothetical protein
VADRDRTGRASAATAPDHRGALARPAGGSLALRVATAAALGVDAVVHWQNAPAYDAVTATLSQTEGAAVVLAALGLRAHRRKHSRMGPLVPVGSDA